MKKIQKTIPAATNAPNTIFHRKESELLIEMPASKSEVRNKKISPPILIRPESREPI